MNPDDLALLTRARSSVLERISLAAGRAGRDPANIQLVAVSKTVPAERLRAATAAGLRDLGENRVQEAAEKQPSVPGARWHLIGPLQSNKARRAVEIFDQIQTVDSDELAIRLDRMALEMRPARPLPILLQVNVDEDPAKAGFTAAGLEAALPGLIALPGLQINGLMTVGRFVTDPEAARPTFVRLRRLSEHLTHLVSGLGPELSMGMSADFEVAVEEGATIVRVGQAIFRARGGLAV